MRISIRLVFCLMLLSLALASCTPYKSLVTVKSVNLHQYAGKWFEIASFPSSFQRGCQCTAAQYGLVTGKDYISVRNRCYRNNRWDGIDGKAFVVPNSGNAKLKVQFFWPFRGDYWIMDLDDNYQYAMVGQPSRKYLWILSRKPTLDPTVYQRLLMKADQDGFPVKKLRKTYQGCQRNEQG
jgi:apolipoprotein D and lipocalin family protein